MLLEARDLVVTRGGRTVVEAPILLVRAGDRIAVTGPNGAGKSTLVACLAGVLPVLTGMVMRHVPVAWMPQRPTTAPMARTTVGEYVASGRAGQRADARAAADALARTGLTGLAGRDLDALSGGERQRTALARALARQAALLIADEPASGLDAAAAVLLTDALRAVPASAAALVVTHDAAFARSWATTCWQVGGGGVTIAPC
jgi:ABC-type Mn2+/Zn2+ transport system ATPase subunit